jgi:dTDP-4-amino-4,6-dideoxygalactose transaminase
MRLTTISEGVSMVTILTTTGNRYISGCVTSQIEQFCQWSRTTEKNTKALFVNHEFGFPYEELHQLQSFGLPIIEDAAHSFASNNTKGNVSQIGDFTVYSFPKFFPIQAGGLLVFRDKYKIQEPVDPPLKQYIQKVVSHHLQHIDITSRKRRANHDYLTASFATLGFSSRFQVTHRSVPGVFMFKTDPSVDLDALKKHMWGNGVECSVFYGEQAFYIPVNDRLECFDLDYFFEAVKAFVNRANPSSNPSSPPPCIMSGGLNP